MHLRALCAQFSVLEPEITYTLPERQTANGVVDAFVHILEQYITYPVNAKVQDRLAEGLLNTLKEEGPTALKNPQDYDARANIMWAATMALNGMLSAGCTDRLGFSLDWSGNYSLVWH